jgi:chemotaxis protein CheC
VSYGDHLFSAEETDILQEVMNIAFGKASAELAEVIDITVALSVPEVQLMRGDELREYIVGHLNFADELSIVLQDFFGRFKGVALLAFPSGAENVILRLMEGDDPLETPSEGPSLLGREALLEVGNILIGACLGKLSALLDDFVTYSPPKLAMEDYRKLLGSDLLAGADRVGITMKTMFSFEKEGNVTGYLFVLTDESALEWLKVALHDYLDAF